MYLSKSFVFLMGAVTAFLLVAFATEEAQCIARARQLLREMTLPVPANVEGEIVCEPTEMGPSPPEWSRPVMRQESPTQEGPATPERPSTGRRGFG